MATITIEQKYIAENADDYPRNHDRYPYYARPEIDLLVEIVGRIAFVDDFRYDFVDGYLQGSFSSEAGLSEMLTRMSSIVEVTENTIDDTTSMYVIAVNNI